MARISRSSILSTSLKEKEFTIASLGGDVLMRELTVKQQDLLRDSCSKGTDAQGKPVLDIGAFRRKLVMESMIEPKLEPSDFEALQEMGGKAFSELQQAAIEINGLEKDVDKERKN